MIFRIQSLVCLLSTAVCIHAAWSGDISQSSAAHHLSLVYGTERIESHFLSHDELTLAVEATQDWFDSSVESGQTHRSLSDADDISRSQKMDAKDIVLPQLTCVMYSSGSIAREALTQTFGTDHVSTLHASESDNRACFLVTTTNKRLEQVMRGGGVSTRFDTSSPGTSAASLRNIDFVLWTSIPTALKLHPSTLHYLGLLGHHPQQLELAKESTLKNPSTQSIDLAKTQLILTTTRAADATATGDKFTGDVRKDVADTVQQLRQILLMHEASPPGVLLDPLLQMYGGMSNHLWSLAAAELDENMNTSPQQHNTRNDAESDGLCSYSSLQVVSEDASIVIGDLHQIYETSPHPTSCVASLLALLAQHPSVVDIRLRHDKLSFNNYIKSIVQSEVYGQGDALYPYLQSGLDGTGQVIGIGDSGLDERSCFFNEGDNSLMNRSQHTAPETNLTRRKVVQYVAYKGGEDTPGGHGTHVSGTVAGSVKSSPNSQQDAEEEDRMRVYGGHAPNAKIAFFDMSEDGNSIFYPSPLGDNVFGPAQEAGAHLHTNSWGGPFNFYDSDTLSADRFQLEHDDFLVLFAAGNDGSDGYYSVADPAVSKNSLTVGASMTNKTIERVAFFSSLGPTFDQRIKPDVVAPGYFTYSACGGIGTNVSCTVVRHAGTSMATPAVAGTAALIRQYFVGNVEIGVDGEENVGVTAYQQVCRDSYPLCQRFSPRGASVKAMLIHSGEAMEEYYTGRYNASTKEPTAPLVNTPPDMYQGFGRIALPNVLPYPNIEEVLDLYIEELAIDSLQEVRYSVVVQDNTRPLKVTVVWMDALNHVISSHLLLHDIDLRVIAPSGEVHYGNNQPGDEMNNVEQVSIVGPLVNVTYEVILQAKMFTESTSQNISLVITSGNGLVSDKVVTDAGSGVGVGYNALACGADEQMVTIRKADRGGDGWGGGRYEVWDITGDSGVLVINGTMTSTASSDIIDYDSVCLTLGGRYNISLHGGEGDEGGVEDMGVTVQQCGVYLSEYTQSAMLHVTGVDVCNPCNISDSSGHDEGNAFSLQLVLVGSLYGIPYGWKGTSKYTLQTNNTHMVSEGTLLVGMLEERKMCLPIQTSYQVELVEVPSTDDFLDDDRLTGLLGVHEYQVGVLGCNNTKYWDKRRAHPGHVEEEEDIVAVGHEGNLVLAKPGHVIHIEIGERGECEMYLESDSSDESTPFPWYLELVVTVIAAMCCSSMIIGCLYCRGVRPKGSDSLLTEGGASSQEDNSGHGQEGNTGEAMSKREVELQMHDYEEEDDDEDDEGAGYSVQRTRKGKGARALSALNLSKLGGGRGKPPKHKYEKFATSS